MIEFVKRYFSSLPDPRERRGRRHRLDELVAIAILGVICATDNWAEVAQFARAKRKWLKTFLELPHGIPSHDTFGRVFAAIEPEAFERCFSGWIQALAKGRRGQLIAIDGKTLRRSFDRAGERSAIHMISAWSSANGLVFGQIATEAKSNEITAIPRLLGLLDLKGTVVSIDAMGCQKEIAGRIVEGGGDYVLALKGNHATMRDDVKLWMDEGISGDLGFDHNQEVHKGHGRIETRRIWSTDEVGWFVERGDWANLNSFMAVESRREFPDGRVEEERRYFISSLKGAGAKRLAGIIRGHWGVENALHWSLDVSFNEDQSRIRNGYAAENFSRLRRIALNLLKRETTEKVGIKAKRLRAGWDEDYLLKVLTG